MTELKLPAPLTAQTLMFGDVDDQTRLRELSRALDEQGVARTLKGGIKHLSDAGCRAVDEQLAEMANDVLDVELGTLLVSAWCKWKRLVDAAKATAEDPERAEVVTLDEQRITSQRKPQVDVLVDGVKVSTFTFILTLEFAIKALVAVVRQAKLVAVECGTTVVTGTLKVEGCPHPLKQCERTIDLPLVVRLGSGIPLIRQQLDQGGQLPAGVSG